MKRKDKISRDLVLEDNTGKPMQAIKVFSESVRFLKDHFLKSAKVAHFDLNDGDIHWVLTIPAIWKDNAKQFMRETAQMVNRTHWLILKIAVLIIADCIDWELVIFSFKSYV